MAPYFLLPLVAALVCLACGVAIWLRDSDSTANRCAAALLAGATHWGVCEALWTLAPDAASAEWRVRASAPGWIAVGPLCLHLFLAQETRSWRGLRRALPFLYALAAGALLLVWTEPWLGVHWMFAGVEPVAWGFAYRVGPAYALWYFGTLLCVTIGITAPFWDAQRQLSPAETSQRRWLGTGIGVPLVLGSVTDGLLPIFGVDVPRLGVASFAVFGATVTWSTHRFGFSVLTPSSFAREILESLPEGVALATPDGRVRVANASLADLLGVPVGDVRERLLADLLPGVHLAADLAIGAQECELATVHGPVPVTLSTAPLRDKQGALLGLVLVVRDLRELAALRSQLLTSARLAAVGELAAGIAHEINNPLAYIGANLRALREQWSTLASAEKGSAVELFDEGASMLDDALEGVDRAAAIVRDVRAFSHVGSDALERFDPNLVLDRVLRVAAPHLRHRVRVVRRFGDVGAIEGARREIEQVFLNLVVNAAQAIEGAGELRVATQLNGREIEIRIADDGRGIAPENLERIFDPFFTTKPAGEGTGLGLSISHEIVRRHGGRIQVTSVPGRGTEFTLTLPAALP
ncbi:MAG: ATP-binding protein [Myxococcota bacterium]|nr:ATP-binding protein [Myxococcota bacterium]